METRSVHPETEGESSKIAKPVPVLHNAIHLDEFNLELNYKIMKFVSRHSKLMRGCRRRRRRI